MMQEYPLNLETVIHMSISKTVEPAGKWRERRGRRRRRRRKRREERK